MAATRRRLGPAKGWAPKSWFSVSEFVTMMNVKIRDAGTRELRLELISVLETVLNKTGNNWGYHPLSKEDDSLREYY